MRKSIPEYLPFVLNIPFLIHILLELFYDIRGSVLGKPFDDTDSAHILDYCVFPPSWFNDCHFNYLGIEMSFLIYILILYNAFSKVFLVEVLMEIICK